MLCLVWAAVVPKTGRNSLSRLLCLQNWFTGRYQQAREIMLESRRRHACFWGLWIFMYLESSRTTCFPGQGFFREGVCKGSPREEGWVRGLLCPSEPGRAVMQDCNGHCGSPLPCSGAGALRRPSAVSPPLKRGRREASRQVTGGTDFLNGWKIQVTKSSLAVCGRSNFSALIILLFLNGFL